MKNSFAIRLFTCAYIFLFLISNMYFSYFAYSKIPDIDKIQTARVRAKQGFLKFTRHIRDCGEELLDLTEKTDQIMMDISSKRDLYYSVQTQEQFDDLKKDRSLSVSYIDGLKKNIQFLKNRCSLLNDTAFIRKADSIKQKLDSHISVLDGVNEHILFIRDVNTKIYNKDKLFDCWLKADNVESMGWDELSFILAQNVGDTFTMKAELNSLNIKYDFTSTYIDLCNIDKSVEIALASGLGKTDREKVLISAEGLKSIKEKSQEILNAVQKAYKENFDFQRLAKLKCSRLNERNADLAGICETPLDNPSWTYTAYHFWDKIPVE